jgi:integrase
LSDSALDLVEVHLADKGGANRSSTLMKKLVAEFGLERATPHDLRRTCLTKITALGFGRDAMDRIANHRISTVTDVYDRHSYADEDKRIMAAIARHRVCSPTSESRHVVLRCCQRDRAPHDAAARCVLRWPVST